ncbi:MAG TPA: GNAT family N-acetyltransferase [Solirubrobacteraceae bacterium]
MTTRRLRLRPFTAADLDALAPMVADPAQMAFHPRPRTRADAAAWIAGTRATHASRGYGLWLVEERATGAFAGYCGVRPLTLDGARETELVWHVHRRLWSCGVGSRRVAEKLGLRPERTTSLDGDPVVVYATPPRPPRA